MKIFDGVLVWWLNSHSPLVGVAKSGLEERIGEKNSFLREDSVEESCLEEGITMKPRWKICSGHCEQKMEKEVGGGGGGGKRIDLRP